MKRELTHDEAFLVLDAVALDALEGPERAAVLAHADNCEVCRVELTEQTALNQHAVTASDSLRVAVMHRDSVIAELTGKDVAMMTLTSSGAKAPFGHMFWDRAKNTWTLVTHNMPDLKPGRTYQ